MPFDFSAGATSSPGDAIYAGVGATEAEAEFGGESLAVQNHGFWGDAPRMVGALLPNLVDSTLASVGITEKGAVNNAMTRTLGLPGYQAWIEQNQEGLDLASGVASLFMDVALAAKIGRAVRGSETLSRLPGMNKITTLNDRFLEATQRAKEVDLALLRMGYSGDDLLRAETIIDGVKVNRAATARKAKLLGQADTALDSLAVEGLFALTQNENTFFFPPDDEVMAIVNVGLGVAIPGAANWIQVGHQLKKFINSDVARKSAQKFYDPAEIDDIFESVSGAAPFTKTKTRTEIREAMKSVEIGTGAYYTDQASMLLLQRDSRRSLRDTLLESPGPETARQSQQAERLANENEKLAFNYLERSMRRGLEGIPQTKMGEDALAANTVRYATRQDVLAFYGAEHVGVIPSGVTGSEVAARFKQAAENRVELIDREIIEAQTSKKLSPQGRSKKINALNRARAKAVQDTELTPVQWYNNQWVDPADLDSIGGVPRVGTVKVVQQEENLAVFEVYDAASGRPTNIGLDSEGRVFMPPKADGTGAKSFNDLTHAETLGWFRAASAFADSIVRTGKVYNLPSNPTWQMIDLGLEIERRAQRPGLVNWGPKLDRESAAVQSFRMKAQIIPSFVRKTRGGTQMPDFLLAERFNLPAMTMFEEATANGTDSNVVRVLRGLTDAKQILARTEREILDGFNQLRFAENMFDGAKQGITSLQGNTFRAGLDAEGNPLAPIIAMKRSINEGFFKRDSLEMRMAIGHAQRVNALTRKAATPLVGGVARALQTDPDLALASRVSTLHDAQRQGTLPGFGSSTGTTTTQFGTFLDRDNPVMLAAGRLGVRARKLGEQIHQERIAPIAAKFAELRRAENTASKFQVERFITAREGWELDKKRPVSLSKTGSGYVYRLEQSEANRNAWFNRFGTQMPEDAVMVDQYGKAIELDDKAHEIIQILSEEFGVVRKENNSLLRAQGSPEIGSIPFYIPPREQTNKFIAFVMDANNKVRFRISADSEKQLTAQIEQLQRDARHPANQPGWTIRPRSSIENFEQGVWQRKHFDFEEPSIPVVGSGEIRTGGGLNAVHEFDAVERVLKQLQTRHIALAQDTLESMMQPALSNAAQRAASLRKEVANVSEGGRQRSITPESRSIHDDYANRLLGRNPLYSRGSPISSAYQVMAGMGDRAAGWLGQVAFSPTQKLKAITPGVRSAKQEYEFLAKEMGGNLPFADVDAFVAQKYGTKRLMDSTELTGQLSYVTATLVLRLFESAQAVMNMAGVLAMSPAVIRAMTPLANETMEETGRRLGFDALVFPRANGQAVTAINMPGLIMGGLRDAMSKGAHVAWDRKMSKGHLTQEVAEFHKHLTQGSYTNDWTRYIKGTPSGRTFMEKNGIIGAASILSDSSENLTRAWANFVGDRVARRMGLVDDTLVDSYAHEFANKVIADYNPTNRPEIFQGPVGNTLGLFQSYIFNYYQNIFRAVETKNYGQLAAQMMGQATFFGAQTIPGFSEYNELIKWASDGWSVPEDRLNQALPRGISDVVMAGIPSSLPQLFGADPGTGIALTARGDTSIRIPGVSGLPAWAVAKKIAGGIGEMADIFFGENPQFTGLQMTEALSHMIPNRPISGMIANFVGEGQTDPTGQLVGEGLDGIKVLSTMMGLKTLQDQRMTEAFYATRAEQELQAAKRKQLVARSRTLIRDGDFDALPEIYNSYLLTGGDPRRFNSWLNELQESATVSRAQRQLGDTLDDPRKMQQTLRMLDAMGGSDSVEGPDEP